MADFGAGSVGECGQRLDEGNGSVQDGSLRGRSFRFHAQRGFVQTGKGGYGARLCFPYP